jgi:hypothetical protein
MARGIGGPMGGTNRTVVLKGQPCGKWKGVIWRDIPTASIRALLEWWSSDEPQNTPTREAIVNALTDEWCKRKGSKPKGKAKRRRKALPPADRHRSMIVVRTRPGR